MKKILSPLMAVALVTGLSAGLQARAADDAKEAAPTESTVPTKKMGHKGHDKKHHKGDDKNGCKGADGKAGCSGDEHKDEKKN